MSTENKKDPMGTVMLIGGVVIIGIAIWFLLNSLFNTIQRNSTVGLDSEETRQMQEQLVAERLKPVGVLKAGYVPKVPPQRTGKQIVADVCGECHVEGSLGAPVIGSKDWAPRFTERGFDGLLKSAQKGRGDMPPRGDDPSLTDKDLMRAIAYMLKESGLNPPVIEPPKTEGAEGNKNEGGAAQPAPEAGDAASAPPAAAPAAAPVEHSSSAAGATGSGGFEPLAGLDYDPFDLPVVPANKRGEAVFKVVCEGCHHIMPPRAGDAADWEHVSVNGMEVVYKSVLEGKIHMPPKGGRLDLLDEDVIAAVNYMASLAK